MYLIFDTETTGLPRKYNVPITDTHIWPRLVQLAWQLHDSSGRLLNKGNYIIRPDGFSIPYNSEKIHGISTKKALEFGKELKEVIDLFSIDLKKSKVIVGHNVSFDQSILGAEYVRLSDENTGNYLVSKNTIDTQKQTIEFCNLSGGYSGKPKFPKLEELYKKLFNEPFKEAHDAAYDVNATAKCLFKLFQLGIITPSDNRFIKDIIYEEPKLEKPNFELSKELETTKKNVTSSDDIINDSFFHIHVHSHYSILQGIGTPRNILKKAKELQMPAVALTDLGNMYGAFEFLNEAKKYNLKPIVGCEFFVAEERKKLTFTRDDPDRRYNQVLLAKNKIGYQNLAKLSSIGFIEGLYGIYPRIDKELIKEHSKGLIAFTGGIDSEIPNLILNIGNEQAEKVFVWYKEIFDNDFYAEIIRHELEEENRVNEVLIDFAKKYDVKIIASNNVYYLNKEDAQSHDTLLCIKNLDVKSTPIGRGRGYRFGFPNEEFYFKTQKEMKKLFDDIPDAITNLLEVFNKIEIYDIERKVVLPKFNIPNDFLIQLKQKNSIHSGEYEYLKHLAYEGARKKYKEITQEIEDRLEFELNVINNSGFPGYFLIVIDIINKAKGMGVFVGPGRGSAAGSVVAYCIGITEINPLKYNLLFERFLNPDRISLPDIDIDFDDEGRSKVIEYVLEKYGRKQVAQIITFGAMKAKNSIRDTARVLELPLNEAIKVTSLIPNRIQVTLSQAISEVKELKSLSDTNDLKGEVLTQAKAVEGIIRNTGIHPCGIIITTEDITNLVPVCTAKDSNMLVTQFNNEVIEKAGMLKIDLLGIKTLTIIKSCLNIINSGHNKTIALESIPADDSKTYELFQQGNTNGIFQFESAGMQKYMISLRPDKFEDLIALNALYRPGPMDYIDQYIKRKKGKATIEYDIPEMEEILSETYGITVYQEQVMLLSQKIAGFSKGDADVLRKAMGKKIVSLIEKLKPKFLNGGTKNGHQTVVLERIWKKWESFAEYAFNKSHATCYAAIAYQTAYLKANYPAEFMAAILTHNQDDIKKVTHFMKECQQLNIKVLGPNINESIKNFTVNNQGQIRFGLGAIKGCGEAAINAVIEERKNGGHFTNIFDFAERVNQKVINKKTLECFALSGAFDCFDSFHRRQYIGSTKDKNPSLIDIIVKYANKIQQEKSSIQSSLFDDPDNAIVVKPKITPIEPFSKLEELNLERELVGLYISSHPLDAYLLEINNFCNIQLSDINQIEKLNELKGKECVCAGIVTDFEHRTTKNDKEFGTLTIEDFTGNHTFYFFGDDYVKYSSFLTKNWRVMITGNVIEKKWSDKQLEFKVIKIELLNKVLENRVKGFKINININDLKLKSIDKIETLCKTHKGKKPVYFEISDYVEDIHNVELFSRNFRVKATSELVDEINKIPELGCEILLN